MTMSLIETVEVGSGGAASIEFTSIPQDGTDLIVVVSGRTTQTGDAGVMRIRFNNDTTVAYDVINLRGQPGGVTSATSTSTSLNLAALVNGQESTSNTFSSMQAYISNYTSSNDKSISIDNVTEKNGSANFDAFQKISAGKYTTSSGISSVTIFESGEDFVQYSTASLYKVTA